MRAIVDVYIEQLLPFREANIDASSMSQANHTHKIRFAKYITTPKSCKHATTVSSSRAEEAKVCSKPRKRHMREEIHSRNRNTLLVKLQRQGARKRGIILERALRVFIIRRICLVLQHTENSVSSRHAVHLIFLLNMEPYSIFGARGCLLLLMSWVEPIRGASPFSSYFTSHGFVSHRTSALF